MSDDQQAERMRNLWDKYHQQIHNAFKIAVSTKSSSVNTRNIIELIFNSYLTWTSGLFCEESYNTCSLEMNTCKASSAIVSIINSIFPNIGLMAIRYYIYKFYDACEKEMYFDVIISSSLVAFCYRQRIIYHKIIFDVFDRLIMFKDKYITHILNLIEEVMPILYDDDPNSADRLIQAIEPLISNSSSAVKYYELLFWKKNNYPNYERIPFGYDFIDACSQKCHNGIDPYKNGHLIDYSIQKYTHYYNIFNFDKSLSDYNNVINKYLEKINYNILKIGENHDVDVGKKEINECVSKSDMKNQIIIAMQSNKSKIEIANELLSIVSDKSSYYLVVMLDTLIDYIRTIKAEKKDFLIILYICQSNKEATDIMFDEFILNYDKKESDITEEMEKEIKNISSLFGYLLANDAMSWTVFSYTKIRSDDVYKHQRLFLKYIFIFLSRSMPSPRIIEKLNEPSVKKEIKGLFIANTNDEQHLIFDFFESISMSYMNDYIRPMYEDSIADLEN